MKKLILVLAAALALSLLCRRPWIAAALVALDGQGGRLTLCYSDANAATVTAGWVAESP